MPLIALCDTISNTSISKSFCSLRSSFCRTIYDALKFVLVLTFFGAFATVVHMKQWSMLLRRCFGSSELLVGLICSFDLTFALHLVSPM